MGLKETEEGTVKNASINERLCSAPKRMPSAGKRYSLAAKIAAHKSEKVSVTGALYFIFILG